MAEQDFSQTYWVKWADLDPNGHVRHDILRANAEKAAALEIEGSWLDLHTRKAMAPPADLLRLFTQAPKPQALEELRSLVRKR